MKNLLIYISPDKKFNDENKAYIEIQIENSLRYWKLDDIMVVTNFPYEYMGVSAVVVPDSLYSGKKSICIIKVNTIVYLLENNILTVPAWFHDTEAWQIECINIEIDKKLLLTDYGWDKKWNGGSFFFKPEALHIFKLWQHKINETGKDDEKALMLLTESNTCGVNEDIRRLNITYNIGKRNIVSNLKKADKPIQVLHFHPFRGNLLKKFKYLMQKDLIELMYEKSIYVHEPRE